jgi:hypothetical protein
MVVHRTASFSFALGLAATVPAGLSLLSFVAAVPLGNHFGVLLFYAAPALAIVGFIIACIALVTARTENVPPNKFPAKLALICSVIVGATWLGIYLWLRYRLG